jgi:peptidoglycan/xylan/chitin deacetylase (PgdA/CDA1 family)
MGLLIRLVRGYTGDMRDSVRLALVLLCLGLATAFFPAPLDAASDPKGGVAAVPIPPSPAVCPDRHRPLDSVLWAPQLTLPILMYHHIRQLPQNASRTSRMLTVTASEFGDQIAYLAREGYHTIYFSDLVDFLRSGTPLPFKPVIVTFDDGWAEQYAVAYPILRRYCMAATFFPPTNWLDQSRLTLTWKQIEEMSRGGMEFGSHTVNHHLMTQESATEMALQLETSRTILQRHVLRPVVALAYPGGAVSAAVELQAAAAGYGVAVGVRAGTRQTPEERFRLHRTTIAYGTTLQEFALKLRPQVGEIMSAAAAAREARHARFLNEDP